MGRSKVIKGTRGNDNLVGTEGKDKIFSGKGDDVIDAGAGNDLIFSGAGNDTVDGGAGHDCIHSGKGDDIVNGGEGNDYIHAGKGDDTVTGGAGDDFVHLGKGNDTAIYVMSDNVDSEDFYHGGRGQDTLRLEFTKEEWLRSDIQADIAAYLAFLNGDDVPDEYWHNRSTFEFNAFNLTAKQFENLAVVVDGEVLDPADQLVDALDDLETVTENSSISGNVLTNDNVPDLVASVELVDDVTKGILTFNPDGTFTYNTNGEFEGLALGEQATQIFTYKVIDADGDEDSATVTITITGENDAPLVSAIDGGTTDEDASPVTIDLLSTATDADSSDDLDTESVLVSSSNASRTVLFLIDNETGAFSLEPNQFNDLTDGESEMLTVSYNVIDGNGGITPNTATLLVEGRNDAPIITVTNPDPVLEGNFDRFNQTATDIQTVDVFAHTNIDDPDTSDTQNFVQGSISILADSTSATMDLGLLTIDQTTGEVSYDRNKFNFLDDGESAIYNVSYQVKSGPDTVTETLVITILGENDAPFVRRPLLDPIDEDTPLIITKADFLSRTTEFDQNDQGSLELLDVELNGASAPYGTLVDNGNDTWTFTPSANFFTDQISSDFHIRVNFKVSDGTAAPVQSDAQFRILPVNDAPTVAAALEKTEPEDGSSASLDLLSGASDVEGDTLTIANITAPLPSGLSLSGSILTIDPADASFQHLAIGDSEIINLSYDIEDGNGGTVGQTATITITGTNDLPEVASIIEKTAKEDDASFVVDLLDGASDPDDGETATLSVANVTPLSFGLTLAGNSITVDPSHTAFQYLAEGIDEVITVNYDIEDAQGGTVAQTANITITGTNDLPEVASIIEKSANEDDGSFVVDLLEGASDPDDGETQTLSVANVTGLEAGLVQSGSSVPVDPKNAAFQSLAVGVPQVITVNYDIVDAQGGTVAQTAKITITGINDDPEIQSSVSSMATEDDAAQVVDLLPTGAITDIDTGDVLSVVAGTLNQTGGRTLNSAQLTGDTLSYNPNDFNDLGAAESEALTFTYDVTDNKGGTVTQTLILTIEGVNDTPNAIDDGFAVNANEVLTVSVQGGVLNNDTDIDATDILTVSSSQTISALGATVTVNTDGSLSYDATGVAAIQALGQGVEQEDTFTYTTSDGNGGEDTATVTVTVTGVNDAPVAEVDVSSVDEDGSVLIDVLDNDSDTNGDALTITTITTPSNGMAVLENGQIRYTPTENISGVDSFTYTIDDGKGSEDTATVTININEIADEPILTASIDGILGINSPANLNIFAEPTDTDGSEAIIQIRVSGLPTGSSLSAGEVQGDGSVILDPLTDLEGLMLIVEPQSTPLGDPLVAFSVQTDTDGDGLSDINEIEIGTNPNNPDTDGDGLLDGVEINTHQTDPRFPDTDGGGVSDGIEVSFGTNPRNNPADDNPAGVADPDNDGLANIEEAVHNTDPNNPDTDGDGLLDGNEVQTYSTDPNNPDTDGGGVSDGDEVANGTNPRNDPADDFPLPDEFVLTIEATVEDANPENGETDTTTKTITLDVEVNLNDAPVAMADAASVDEDGSVLIDVLDNDSDVDGDALTITDISVPTNGTAVLENGQIRYTPTMNFSGIASFAYTIDDGKGAMDTTTVTININPIADEPTLSAVVDGRIGLDLSAPLNIMAAVTDLDGSEQVTQIKVSGLPQGVQLFKNGMPVGIVSEIEPGVVFLNPTVPGDDSDLVDLMITGGGEGVTDFILTIEATVEDTNPETGDTDTTTNTTTVDVDVNAAPVAVDLEITTNEDTAVTIDALATASDPDGDDLTLELINTSPQNGTVEIIDSEIVYTPNAEFSGQDSFDYRVSDGFGGSSIKTVSVNITPDADTPTLEVSLDGEVLPLGTAVGLDIQAMIAEGELNENPASEQITQIKVSGLPVGVSLSAGVVQMDGSVLLDPTTDLAGLTIIANQAPGIFDASFELSSLLAENGGDGSNGFTLNGIAAGDQSGLSVSGVGDINGDGIDDLIIGAFAADPNGVFVAGESYVVFGQDTVSGPGFEASFELSSLLASNGGDGSNGFVLNGIDTSDQSGWSVSGAGDINGDGIDDLIIGAYAADPNGDNLAGESYVVFGQDTVSGPGFEASFELSSLLASNGGDGSNGFILNGIDASDQSGWSVSGAGDINGDGIDDLIIGAITASPNGSQSGESYVVFGQDTVSGPGFEASFELSSLLASNGGDGSNGFVLNGIDIDDQSGFSVSGVGDINADGIDDFIIGSDLDDAVNNNSGEAYVVFGQDTMNGVGFSASLDLSTLNGTNGFLINGIDGDGRRIDYSVTVSRAGDINGDGVDDLIIGSSSADPGGVYRVGVSYVVFGQDSMSGSVFSDSLDLSALDGNNGFVLNGIDTGDQSGHSVSGVGDINGDGIDDLIIGAYAADPNGVFVAGESYVVFGQDTVSGPGFEASFELSSLLATNGGDGSNGFVLNGIDTGDQSGHSVSRAGDINGDGIDDLIIGAVSADPNGDSSAGESYVVFGRQDLAPEDFQLTVEATVLDTNLDNPTETDTTTVSTTLDVDVNQNPTIEAASFTVDENEQDVGTITFSDPDEDDVTIALTENGTTDNALFEINAETGLLTFITAPDFENPQDIGTDNIYEIEVEVTDDKGGSALEQFQVTVDDVGEAVLQFTATDPFNFGNFAVGQNDAIPFNLTNIGVDAASEFIPTVNAPFTILGGSITAITTLEPGDSASIIIEYLPLEAGVFEETLSLAYYNGGVTDITTLDLFGTAAL